MIEYLVIGEPNFDVVGKEFQNSEITHGFEAPNDDAARQEAAKFAVMVNPKIYRRI